MIEIRQTTTKDLKDVQRLWSDSSAALDRKDWESAE